MIGSIAPDLQAFSFVLGLSRHRSEAWGSPHKMIRSKLRPYVKESLCQGTLNSLQLGWGSEAVFFFGGV